MASRHPGPGPRGFEVVARRRPVALVQPGTRLPGAPYVAVEADLSGERARRVELVSGDTGLRADWDGRGVAITVHAGAHTSRHVSRRHGRGRSPDALGLTLTGDVVTAFTREGGAWVARSTVDLASPPLRPARDAGLDVHDEGWLRTLRPDPDADRAGTFGQLGLRDLRVVTEADGSAYAPYADGRPLLLTATSAGPGGFRTGHTSVWSLDPESLDLTHRADLFFRRPDRPGVYGDHASHVLRDEGSWLVTTSTWGDFDPSHHPHVSINRATSTADLLTGAHVLDTRPLHVPTTGFASVGTWDPHVVRTSGGWLVAFVSASRYFSFHPVLASGPDLDSLSVRAAATDRVACEGPTLARLDGEWRLLASDGPDSARSRRASYPVLDLDLEQLGTLDAVYPSNVPWPTLAQIDGGWLMIGFDDTSAGGPLPGYGTHGDVVVQRSRS